MKKLNFKQLEMIQGGKLDQATVCGLGVALAIFVPNPFTIGLALATCLSGDTAQ